MLGRNYRVHDTLDNANRIMNNTFWLGIWPGLDSKRLGFMASRLETFVGVNF